MADESFNTGKLINELRVIDLKQELENRGLDRTGVKAALIDRLKKALEDEGENPSEFRFIESKKMGDIVDSVEDSLGLEDGVDLGDLVDAEILDEVVEENGIDTNAEGLTTEEEENLLKESSTDRKQTGDKPSESESQEVKMVESEVEQDNNTSDAVSSETKEIMDETGDEGVQIEVQPESSEMEYAEVKDDVKDSEAKTSEGSAAEENKENTLASSLFDEFPPTPTSVKPVMEFTSEDTINMDTSSERKEDDISLIVHVDETLNEFDDLVSNASGASLSTMGQEKSSGQEKAGEKTDEASAPAPDADASKEDSQKTDGAEDKEATAASTDNKSADNTDKAKPTDKDGTATASKETSKPADKAAQEKAKSNANSRNLWISGLATTTRATDLKTLFSKYGKVAGAKVVTNARSPMSKCYGFVTMNTADEASKCIQHLHRTELHGRMISVERAKADPSQTKVTLGDKKAESSDERDQKSVGKRDDYRDRYRVIPGMRRRFNERSYRNHRSSYRSRSRERRHPERKPGDSNRKEETRKDESKKEEKKDESKKREEKKEEGSKDEGKTETNEEKKEGDKVADKSEETKIKDDKASKDEKSGDEKRDRKSSEGKDGDRKSKIGRDGKPMLSLQQITEERERERSRLLERRTREEERRRRETIERDRLRQRHESMKLQRERDRLRIERERLEREKLEAERERILFEREKRERERAEIAEQRRQEALRYEERQRALKRPYDRPLADDYWGEPKRAAFESSPPSRFNDFDRDHRGPARGYSRDAYPDRPPRERSYERGPPGREPPRFEERRDDRDRRDRDRDDRLAPSDRYRYEAERSRGRDAPSREHGSSHARPRSSDRHDTRRVSPHRPPRDASPSRSRDKPRESHRDSRGTSDRSYTSGRDSWQAPPARRSHDKDASSYARTSVPSNPSPAGPPLGSDKHSSWQEPGRVIVPAAAARPGSQWVSAAAPMPGRSVMPQPVLQAQHPAAGHPGFLISAANIISAGLGTGLAPGKPEAARYGPPYGARRY